MIVCKHCSTKNGIDSRFCSSCGLELSDEDRDRARVELDKLVADGYSLLGQGRTEEAALVAEKVLEDNPDFAEALSLLGMCHERNHDPIAALGCYERVVELRPDSALDKIKVQQLRNAITREAKEGPRANRGMALLGAAAAIILVGSIGGIVATFITRPANAAVAEKEPMANSTDGAPFSTSDRVNVSNPQTTSNEPKESPAKDPATSGTGTGTPNTYQPRLGTGGGAPGTLPSNEDIMRGANGNGDSGEKPFNPGEIVIKPENNGGTGKPDANDPGVDGDKGSGGASTPPVAEDPNKGIEINVHRGAGSNGGGGQDANADTGGGLTTMLKVARDKFMLGKYGEAASSYERALKMGGDPGSVNQRLGQCYERLGRTSDAINAYTRAESAMQAAVNSGKGSKSALEAVRQALSNLRGN